MTDTTKARRTIRFTLNGRPVAADIGLNQNITEVLQDSFGLGGSRESCGQGLCGCCTVIMDGKAVTGCLTLAAFADGASVTTVEGLADGETLSAEQEAFIETGAFQCGFCTPGMVMSAVDIAKRHPNASELEIRELLEGNLCRCTGYQNIVKAVQQGSAAMKA